MNRLQWLVKREFWEHKGGFFWAPIWTAATLVGLTLMGAITAEVFKAKFSGGLSVGVSIRDLIEKQSAEQMAQLGPAIDVGMMGLTSILSVVLFFVLFFYLLGALYDDRRDRSVLFWKSLPLSDRDTVLSKIIAAAVLAPLISFVVGILLHISILSIMSIHVMFYGINPMSVIWGPAEPLMLWLKLLVEIPLNALWALPCIGWLLLVSAFARSKPFLWAVLVPVGLGLMISWFDVLSTFSIPDATYWLEVLFRVLGGIFPGAYKLHLAGSAAMSVGDGSGLSISGTPSWSEMGGLLTSMSTWVGAVAGIAMITGSVYLRRWRDEA